MIRLRELVVPRPVGSALPLWCVLAKVNAQLHQTVAGAALCALRQTSKMTTHRVIRTRKSARKG